jgi:hypothetical protein
MKSCYRVKIGYDLDATPPDPHELERLLSSSHLERGR